MNLFCLMMLAIYCARWIADFLQAIFKKLIVGHFIEKKVYVHIPMMINQSTAVKTIGVLTVFTSSESY